MRLQDFRLDWEFARRGYARYAAYPAATIAGLFTNVVFGSMRGSILLALFEGRYGTERTLVVDLEEPAPPLDVDGGRVVRVDGPRQWIAFERERTTAARLAAAVAARAPIRDLTVEEPDIEDVVRRIYGERRKDSPRL